MPVLIRPRLALSEDHRSRLQKAILPRDRAVVRQVIGRPIAQRPLLGAARFPIPNRPVRNAPVLRHTI